MRPLTPQEPVYVTYAYPENGHLHDQRDAECLVVGHSYKLQHMEVREFQTRIFLKGFPKSFNSVLFDGIAEEMIQKAWAEQQLSKRDPS